MAVRKRKSVNYEIIHESFSEPYELLEEAMTEWHEDLSDARIGLAWRKKLKPDVDGNLVLGRCVRVSDLQKEFAQFDFIIVLNREVWNDEGFTRDKKLALLDHELCHAAPALDKEGEEKVDERGRRVWRTRRHDIEEFQSVVSRHGCYKRDLERFAEAMLQKKREPLLAAAS